MLRAIHYQAILGTPQITASSMGILLSLWIIFGNALGFTWMIIGWFCQDVGCRDFLDHPTTPMFATSILLILLEKRIQIQGHFGPKKGSYGQGKEASSESSVFWWLCLGSRICWRQCCHHSFSFRRPTRTAALTMQLSHSSSRKKSAKKLRQYNVFDYYHKTVPGWDWDLPWLGSHLIPWCFFRGKVRR